MLGGTGGVGRGGAQFLVRARRWRREVGGGGGEVGAHEEKEADWTLNSGLVAMIMFGDGLGALIHAATFLGK